MIDRSERAAHLGMTEAEYDDLQIWLRHGRIGVGRTYQQEVERSRRIEAERMRTVVSGSTEGGE
ncbi:hypothetical protein [Bradyrhizobium phage ppBeUSDA76-2]|nr:hypothetical protein [Bradyrhizobium elkanii]WAX24377.1 hypothetical protein [Bradyrhizobium phage ppBeUSDA76-2]MCP1732472.1 hypothetical protein [Bradyrhizobium elkanii]MCS3567810.1 hypothetical protein [Bradyrhizobium elkanii]MCS3590707.1 hypothetical protein [Bradyrhizobium elkanii]MCS3620150.1 hypothetical protein [Bradyrhizobium elkanii]